MARRELIVVCSQNCTKRTYPLCEQNVEFVSGKHGNTSNNDSALTLWRLTTTIVVVPHC
jgi:hypothetical protein